ncbi:hypothetical protein [Vibrio vulnificus]|uniref:hypothetical protein n=1 Tax=Vibrio vulnificus TaxID=672 RepID=UPI000CD2A961|nr:hypothetical protein [Vibrio vulnificus]AVW98963.1 hypothetical protein BJD94_03090 [Vibrio vulnificus Env1]POB67493.1 hypothetical protein CRN59_25290 [Vibrio vulnificus]POC69780.1 hypothetical protein CRN56_02675 [Vibrio vulnificus Env1]
MTTSNEKLIYDKLLEIYPNQLIPITELSLNDSANKMFVESTVTGFNFDSVLNCHPDCAKKEKSPDALFYVDEKLYFVEFKEGGSKKEDIRLKIHEAVATIYNFSLQQNLGISRKDFFEMDIRYAVIYRENKINPNPTFASMLEMTSKKYHLKNLEGYIVKKTRVAGHPVSIFNVLKSVSGGSVASILIHKDGEAPIQVPA